MANYGLVKSVALRRCLARRGFALLPGFVPHDALAEAQKVFAHFAFLFSPHTQGAQNTIVQATQQQKEQIHHALLPHFMPFLEKHFESFKVALCAYYIKHPHSTSLGHLHQDPTLADLPHASLSVWLPLHTCTAQSGTLAFVPFSHRIFNELQDKTTPLPFSGTLQFFERFLSPLELQAGEAVVFDNNVLHTSTPNLSDTMRVALGFKLLHRDAQLCTVFEQAGERFKLYQPDNFYYHPLWNDSFQMPPTTIKKLSLPLSKSSISPAVFWWRWQWMNLWG